MNTETILCDLHTHSNYSFDGRQTFDALCAAAAAAQIGIVAVTDHCDIDGILDGIYPPYDGAGIDLEIAKVREKYAGKLEILHGIELGQPHCAAKEARALLDAHDYDFVLCSLHNLPKCPDFCFWNYGAMDQTIIEHFFAASLDEMLKILDFGGVNSLAHITYPVRYMRRFGKMIDYAKFSDRFDRLFDKLMEKNVALELNVSGLREEVRYTMPDRELMERYYAAGGREVTIGSDAHRSPDVGRGIAEGTAMLREIGFDHIRVCRHGKPGKIGI